MFPPKAMVEHLALDSDFNSEHLTVECLCALTFGNNENFIEKVRDFHSALTWRHVTPYIWGHCLRLPVDFRMKFIGVTLPHSDRRDQ
jgi:hypothetical protein